MIGNDKWKRYIYSFDIDKTKKVKSIDLDLIAEDFSGIMQFTDMQFQEGTQISANIPATQDMLTEVEFNIDEMAFITGVSNWVKDGNVQPQYFSNVRNRFYNLVGRGHSVVAIPNVFHEDYTFPIVTTGLDIELYPKEDYDLLRIRTYDGGLVEGRQYSGFPSLADHPLNYKYTREFYFDGGSAGDKLELKATIHAAKANGASIPMKKHDITVRGSSMTIDRQRFMLAPAGSFRIGIEFYKQVTETLTNDDGDQVSKTYLKDTGIGYHGLATLNQWTYGVSKL
ncbi:hypothetical protein [Priestia megaterium]|uniref:hypothetical protein n=1 Tax=Priestia megaterium TaxID=1404 RepID=UPI000BEBCC3D|nr:hypothetical protein [Priestia megaterium]PED63963.1 hypothetical protein CON20_23640 [Priestia megaterium]